jgi:hypothetical protein
MMRKIALALVATACQPAYAEIAPDGRQIYSALVVDYSDDLDAVTGGIIFTEYAACTDAMNSLDNMATHAPATAFLCIRIVADGGGKMVKYQD